MKRSLPFLILLVGLSAGYFANAIVYAQSQASEVDYSVVDRVSDIPTDYSSSSKAWVFQSVDSALIEQSFLADQRTQTLEQRVSVLERIIFRQ